MSITDTFESAISNLDLSLFKEIESQSTDADKASFLACQLATRELRPQYNYLEIGSHLGGSIQPYLQDPRCVRIFSIDKRGDRQPDERGMDYIYLNNSTARMMENLSRVGSTEKITTIDGSTGDISTTEVDVQIDICFIDGEHTDTAVVRDFTFCLETLRDDGAIFFHDAQITYNGIEECVRSLEAKKTPFKAYALPNVVFVIEVGDFALHKHRAIYERLINNHEAYLYSLKDNDHFRRFANRKPFRMAKDLLIKWHGSNISR